ncbi:DNA replication protein DnaD [Staphylococcus chromogenes]|uniref:DNA replication protein DnaD n=2 Tax=Staphylococcus chromogenes TaxID=46126 RepID=A0ABX5I6W2_STACR|nr:DnaD domain protein [Staphylococcus chromogenes]MCD9070629.1 DnaD domain protein [Staphylococcus chromogenes]PTG67123.1 DNA replication protein DnaD [Staphylococcus chromogenes]PTG86106.1 DNA replication protein DnaD [Staphylococcus chromogenes]PTH03372.1 DNA replication protein DnaD [Staphylococcus chromogenes]RIM13236.1 DnaD domain protein [Staphylococcus chromogenes]
MATFRVYKESGNFVTVHKDFIHDSNISWKAKGILLYLLSRPDDWQIYETELVKHSVDGLSGLKSGIKELEEKGYIQRNRKRDAKGRLKEYEYAVYEQPNHIRFSNVGNSYIGKTYVGESHPTNNNSTNNDLTNNKDTNNVTDETIKIFQLVSKELETIQSPLKVQQLENEIESFKEDKLEIVELAINYCKENNKGINYLIKILENWNKEGITTKDRAEQKIKPKQTTNSILDELEIELGDN